MKLCSLLQSQWTWTHLKYIWIFQYQNHVISMKTWPDIILHTRLTHIRMDAELDRSDYSRATFAYTDPNPALCSLHDQVEVDHVISATVYSSFSSAGAHFIILFLKDEFFTCSYYTCGTAGGRLLIIKLSASIIMFTHGSIRCQFYYEKINICFCIFFLYNMYMYNMWRCYANTATGLGHAHFWVKIQAQIQI